METCTVDAAPIQPPVMQPRDLVWGGGALTLVLFGCAVALWRSWARARTFCRALEQMLEVPLSRAPREGTVSGVLPARIPGVVRVPEDGGIVSPVTGRPCAYVEVRWRQDGRWRSWSDGGPAQLVSEHASAWIDLSEASLEGRAVPVPEETLPSVERLAHEVCGPADAPALRFDPYRGLGIPGGETPGDFHYREVAVGETVQALGVVRGDPTGSATEGGPYRAEVDSGAEVVGARGLPLIVRRPTGPPPHPSPLLLPLASSMTALAALSLVVTMLHWL